MRDEVILSIKELSGGYLIRHDETQKYIDAVNNINLTIEENQIVGIAGESGCGKSTLLRMIYGYIKSPLVISKGQIILKKKNREIVDLLKYSEEKRKNEIWWKEMSWIPQNSMNVLNPTIKIKDHFMEILKHHLKRSGEEADKLITEYLSAMGLSKDVLKAFPHQLSGGMRQRIVIALALLANPQIILADEPTTALDVVMQRGILQLLMEYQRTTKNTIIIVTHDLGIHSMLSDQVIIIYAGKIVEVGSAEVIFENPAHPYTAALLESLPRLENKNLREGIYGAPPDLSNPPTGCRFHPRCPKAISICGQQEPYQILLEKEHSVACWLYAER